MKNVLCCLLVLALCAAAVAPAPVMAASQTITVDYDDLADLVVDGNAAFRGIQQEIRRLELTHNELQWQYGELFEQIEAGAWMLISSLGTIRASMRQLREVIDELKDSISSRVIQITFPAQMMYMSHYILMIELDIALREMESLELELTNTQLRLSRGLASQREVTNAERAVRRQQDVLKARRDSIDDNLEALAKHLGIIGTIELGDLPEIDIEKITERDPEDDLAAYIIAASAPAEKALEDARTEARRDNTAPNRHVRDVASQELRRVRLEAEADFPKIYDSLLEAYDDFIDFQEVVYAQEDYDSLEAQYERGLVSRNMLLSIERHLDNMKDRHEQMRLQLWMQFMEYEFGLIKLTL